MRLSGILIIVLLFILPSLTYGEEIPLKLNQKEVDIGGKSEKFYSLFPDPPAEIKIQGPSKIKIFARKIVDKKNPLTKLPVTLTVSLNNNKVKEIMLNDREGTAVIKDAAMFNAGAENIFEIDIPQGEQILTVSVTKSAIKGLLIRIEKKTEEKTAAVPSPLPAEEKKADKEFVPPIIPPLAPLVSPEEKKPVAETKSLQPQPESKHQEATKKETREKPVTPPVPVQTATGTTEMPVTTEKQTKQKRDFGDIVILSIKGGTILPFEYGNPGGYGEFSTSFSIYRGIIAGVSIASYNINRDYIINDPNTGNAILKYHLHGVPISGFIGYKYQMQSVFAKFELGSGVNMVDLDIRRKHTPEKTDTINSVQINSSAELSYILKYGSAGMGIRYLYSISDNKDSENGFAENINSGGLIITVGYHYGF
ncbi:MAG: hypothetical protein N3B13_00585 [Deltaproteobacteria bacterium]|nr:hypothetical protein [Deltaproteobacteria bacterium]